MKDDVKSAKVLATSLAFTKKEKKKLREDFTSYKSTVSSWFSFTMSACENNPSEVLFGFSKQYCLAFGFFVKYF